MVVVAQVVAQVVVQVVDTVDDKVEGSCVSVSPSTDVSSFCFLNRASTSASVWGVWGERRWGRR